MTPLERARLVAARYPETVKTYGGIKVDGISYYWDPVRNVLLSPDGIKAERKVKQEAVKLAKVEAPKPAIPPPKAERPVQFITSRGWKIEMSDVRCILHHKVTDQLMEFGSIEEAYAAVRGVK